MQKGFAHILLLVIVLIVGAVGAAYYFGYDVGFEKAVKTTEQNMEATSSSSSSVNDKTTSWKTYTNNNLGFSLKYPDDAGYEIYLDGDQALQCVFWGVPETDNGFSVCLTDLEGSSLNQWLMNSYSNCSEQTLCYSDLKQTEMNVSNLKAVKVEQTTESLKQKNNIIVVPYIYIFKEDGRVYQLGGYYDEKVPGTFKFTE